MKVPLFLSFISVYKISITITSANNVKNNRNSKTI